ncbi:MAG: polyprenyl diphosphate synthase [Gammaproteobacteria bacterium]|nr:di-trans,poly-cis-decaprenylcistransferase [Gammaproteobacteria bacterium]
MHVAIIMDGNGRWAVKRGLPRPAGHRAGAETVRRIVEAAVASQVSVLTLYAFSADNWLRPRREVSALMKLMKRYLVSERLRCIENGIRVNVIGRRDRLAPELVRSIEDLERATAHGDRLLLRLAVDYSSRQLLLKAARESRNPTTFEEFERCIESVSHSVPGVPSVDLLIRTGGEQRLSDFLLWECAYAELVFSDTYWPDYTEAEFRAALDEYSRRDRRFGQLSGQLSQRSA